jgi:hypothetical protein
MRCDSPQFEGLVTRMVTQPDCRGISSRRSRAHPTAEIEPALVVPPCAFSATTGSSAMFSQLENEGDENSMGWHE